MYYFFYLQWFPSLCWAFCVGCAGIPKYRIVEEDILYWCAIEEGWTMCQRTIGSFDLVLTGSELYF